MQTKFTTSTNIIRDSAREINYIPTPNANRVVNQIADDFKKGIRSFNIIGSYGTGKSSFLWALQQSLQGKKKFFNFNLLQTPKVEVINFIGEFKSITNEFGHSPASATHKANTQAGSGYPLQSFFPIHNANAAKRISATIPNAKYRYILNCSI